MNSHIQLIAPGRESVSHAFVVISAFYASGFWIEPAGNPLCPKNAVTYFHEALLFAS